MFRCGYGTDAQAAAQGTGDSNRRNASLKADTLDVRSADEVEKSTHGQLYVAYWIAVDRLRFQRGIRGGSSRVDSDACNLSSAKGGVRREQRVSDPLLLEVKELLMGETLEGEKVEHVGISFKKHHQPYDIRFELHLAGTWVDRCGKQHTTVEYGLPVQSGMAIGLHHVNSPEKRAKLRQVFFKGLSEEALKAAKHLRHDTTPVLELLKHLPEEKRMEALDLLGRRSFFYQNGSMPPLNQTALLLPGNGLSCPVLAEEMDAAAEVLRARKDASGQQLASPEQEESSSDDDDKAAPAGLQKPQKSSMDLSDLPPDCRKKSLKEAAKRLVWGILNGKWPRLPKPGEPGYDALCQWAFKLGEATDQVIEHVQGQLGSTAQVAPSSDEQGPNLVIVKLPRSSLEGMATSQVLRPQLRKPHGRFFMQQLSQQACLPPSGQAACAKLAALDPTEAEELQAARSDCNAACGFSAEQQGGDESGDDGPAQGEGSRQPAGPTMRSRKRARDEEAGTSAGAEALEGAEGGGAGAQQQVGGIGAIAAHSTQPERGGGGAAGAGEPEGAQGGAGAQQQQQQVGGASTSAAHGTQPERGGGQAGAEFKIRVCTGDVVSFYVRHAGKITPHPNFASLLRAAEVVAFKCGGVWHLVMALSLAASFPGKCTGSKAHLSVDKILHSCDCVRLDDPDALHLLRSATSAQQLATRSLAVLVHGRQNMYGLLPLAVFRVALEQGVDLDDHKGTSSQDPIVGAPATLGNAIDLGILNGWPHVRGMVLKRRNTVGDPNWQSQKGMGAQGHGDLKMLDVLRKVGLTDPTTTSHNQKGQEHEIVWLPPHLKDIIGRKMSATKKFEAMCEFANGVLGARMRSAEALLTGPYYPGDSRTGLQLLKAPMPHDAAAAHAKVVNVILVNGRYRPKA